MNTVVKGSKIRSLMIVVALSGSVFLAACNGGGGSVNNTQSSTPVVKEQKSKAIDKLNSSVKEPSENSTKEQQEKQDGTEKNKSGTDNQGGAEGKSDQKSSGN